MKGQRPQTEKYRHWDSELEEKLKQLVLEGKLNYIEMSKQHFPDRTPISLLKKARKLKIYSNYRFRKYSFNENFWETPNPINCYWAGFSAGDCNLSKEKFVYTLSLNTKDVKHIELLKETIKYNGKIRSYERKNYKKDTIKQVSTMWVACGEKWYKDLEQNFNVITFKSRRLAPPNLSNDYLKFCYIIGYLDADGWITLPTFKKNNSTRLTLGFVSSSKPILDWIKEQFDQYFKIEHKDINRNYIYKPKATVHLANKKANYNVYTPSGLQALVLFDFLKDFNLPKLSRKWAKLEVLELLEQNKQKYPELFAKNDELREKLFHTHSLSV